MPGSARVYLWGSPAWVKGDPHLGPILLMIGSGCFWAEVWEKVSRGNWDQLQRFKSRGFRIFSWFRGEMKPGWRDGWSENTESSEEWFLWKGGHSLLDILLDILIVILAPPFPFSSLFTYLASVFPPGKKVPLFPNASYRWLSPDVPLYLCSSATTPFPFPESPPFPFPSSDHLNPAIPLSVALRPPYPGNGNSYKLCIHFWRFEARSPQ